MPQMFRHVHPMGFAPRHSWIRFHAARGPSSMTKQVARGPSFDSEKKNFFKHFVFVITRSEKKNQLKDPDVRDTQGRVFPTIGLRSETFLLVGPRGPSPMAKQAARGPLCSWALLYTQAGCSWAPY